MSDHVSDAESFLKFYNERYNPDRYIASSSSPFNNNNSSLAVLTTTEPTKAAVAVKHVSRRIENTISPVSNELALLKQKKLIENDKKLNVSRENWLSTSVRYRQIQREFLSLEKSVKHLVKIKHEQQIKPPNELAQAKMEEELRSIKYIRCGCCSMKYLPLNLCNQVPKKAIMDLRRHWNESNTTNPEPIEDIKSYEIGRLYDLTPLCRFCAQFFVKPEEYRPTLEQIAQEERDKQLAEARAAEELYWDPLKRLELERSKQLR